MEEYRTRVRIFAGIILVTMALLAIRLGHMQIVDAHEYTGESRSNAIREQRVRPARGVLYDRNNILMVDNEPTYSITVTPRYFNVDQIPLLARLLDAPDSVVYNRYREARQWSAFRPSPMFREVPFEVLSRVQENLYRIPGIWYEVDQKRRYLTDARASHALGYIREISRQELERRREDGYRPGDLVGQAGIERNYEDFLRGRLGSEFKLVNVHGLEVKAYRDGAEDTPPMSGYDLLLNIDSRVQALAESLFVNKRGSAVALDVRTGGIIAFVSKPDYDPDIFSRTVPRETWDWLMNSPERPMYNRPTQSGLPPGSTWKPFMSVLALQEGIINENSRVTCTGGYTLGGRRFRCLGVHGPTDVRRAIAVSCNTFYYTMMMRTDVNTFKRYADMFGMGREMPMDLREQTPGLIPDSSYYNRTYPRGWTVGYSINLGIGQGDMYVTSMELARFTMAVANGGTLFPAHLVRELRHPETGEIITPMLPAPEMMNVDPHVLQVVREGMQQTMEAGTGRGSIIPGITSGGKTGTVQAGAGRENHSMFIMFAPAEAPEIAIAVFVENAGGGSRVAAPIASLMAEQFLKGYVEDNPQRRGLIERMMMTRSEPIPQRRTN
jgi:penicillin-binding protein 2